MRGLAQRVFSPDPEERHQRKAEGPLVVSSRSLPCATLLSYLTGAFSPHPQYYEERGRSGKFLSQQELKQRLESKEDKRRKMQAESEAARGKVPRKKREEEEEDMGPEEEDVAGESH